MITNEAPEAISTESGKNRWFQMGLITAGAMAPLIARWQSLRAAEQAEALRDEASTRWNDAVDWVSQALPQEAIQETLRHALPQAQGALRQVGPAAAEALRRLPIPALSREQAPVPAPLARTSNRRVSVTLWTIGVGVGLVAAGTAAFIILRNRMNENAEDETLVEIPLTHATSADALARTQAVEAASEGPAIVQEEPAEEPDVAEEPHFSEEDATGAMFVGNIHSGVYQPIGSKRLPAPEHRTYFASEEQAVRAGYRRNGD